jgi:3-isopropylmalate/(R)-2-methylmalate dehydratase small subunit
MKPLLTLSSPAAALPDADIDTDIIFPARFLLITAKAGLGRYAFFDRRAESAAAGRPFPLQIEGLDRPSILMAGPNFGCGSSREQAVWALRDLGIQAILAPSFGEIFRSNCFKSGVLPITLSANDLAPLDALQSTGTVVTIDLVERRIRADGLPTLSFEIEDWQREALMNGWDDVLVLLNTQATAIAAFERSQSAQAPWLYSQVR